MKLVPKILTLLLWSLLLLAWTALQVSWAETLDGEQASEVKKLSLISVEVADMDILKLSFWVAIDDTKEKDFIVKSLPLWDEISVNQIAVDKDSVLLSIEKDFESNKQYEVVIISLYWTDGSTIISGIDWAVEFSAPDMSKFNDKEEVVAAINENTIEETEEPELNSAESEAKIKADKKALEDKKLAEEAKIAEDKKQEEKKNKATKTVAEKIDQANKKNNAVNLWGKEVNQEELDKNITVAAGKAGDLPTTWPEHVFFVILALVLAGLIIHIRRKKI